MFSQLQIRELVKESSVFFGKKSEGAPFLLMCGFFNQILLFLDVYK